MGVNFERTERFELRLSREEKQTLEEAAKKSRVSLADWLRTRSMKTAEKELQT